MQMMLWQQSCPHCATGRQAASYSGYAFMCHVHVHVRVQLWLRLQIEQQPLAKWWMCCCWWNMKADKERISDSKRERRRQGESECELIGKLSSNRLWVLHQAAGSRQQATGSRQQHKTFRHSQLRQNVTQFKVATNWLANYLTNQLPD